MLDADRQADHVFRDTGLGQFFGRQLAVRGRCRVAGQRLAVADIDQTGDQLQRVLELAAAFAATLDAEIEDAGSLSTHVFLHQRVILVVGQAEVEGLRKRIEALSGPGGEALLKTELVDHLTKNNPKFVILNTSNQAAGSVDLMRIDANDLLSRAGALSALSAGNDEKTAPKPAEPVAK